MRFFFIKVIIFFLFTNFVQANNNVKFVDINYIVNNSISGKNLNKIIENKNKKTKSELAKIGKKLEEKKNSNDPLQND